MFSALVGNPAGFCPRGGAFELWKYRGHEAILAGPSETGKTYACLQKLNALAWKYPRSQSVVIRKTLNSLHTSVMSTYRKVLGADTPVTFYGGGHPEWADYPNGSRIYFAGLDNPQKTLSSERDFIFVNQAEELTVEDWEVLTTRCTGRAGNAPYSQLMGDCNPGPPQHWILHRPSLRVIESRHEDNPTLYDDAGKLTDDGRKTMAILDRLTGVRRDRLRFGKWVSAEGVVYQEFDRRIHLIEPFRIPDDWPRIRAIDFGYTNPFVCQWWAVDGDARLYLYREIYRTERLVSDHAARIKALSGQERFRATVSDTDAEDRATLDAAGIPTIAAWKSITPGLEAVRNRLKIAGDGKARLFILKDSLVDRDESLASAKKPCCTLDEFEVYINAKSADGRPIKEEPVKLNDHGMDAMRYAVAHVDNLGQTRRGQSTGGGPGYMELDQVRGYGYGAGHGFRG